MRKIDENAFVRAYDEYADPIFRYCLFRLRDRDRAQDVLQETFTKTWDYVRSGKHIDELRPFLYTVAHNLCVNEIARRKPLSLDGLQEDGGFDPESAEQSPEQEAEARLLLSKMEELRDSDQELLTLRYLSGLEVQEIAQLLRIPPNTASVRIRRALDALREKMGERHE
jgi:RNA polymerase sigma-70 factor, ECF subfamily